MKKITSIVLTAVMLLSLMCITAFAEDNSDVSIAFTAPKVGDQISSMQLSLTLSSTSLSNAFCNVQNIYDDAVRAEIFAIETFEDYDSFRKSTSPVSGVYEQKSYVAIFSVSADSLPENPTIAFPNGITGEYLFTNTDSPILYGYFVFTPTSDTSADTSTSDNESESRPVYATYEEGETPQTIYSVDMTWDSMEFTYTAASKGTWNATTHQYENQKPASWSFENNSITVVNHSNAAITADFSYVSADGFDGITGTFIDVNKDVLTSTSITLSSADASNSSGSTRTQVFLRLSGDLPASTSSKTKCGTVTVTIQ